MAKNKNIDTKSILDEEIKITDIPSVKEQEVISAVFSKFRITADKRNQNFQNFDGESLIEYINDSVRRYITNVDFREDLEDWQARVHDPFTRNKVTAILGKVVRVLPIAEIVGRGDEDIRKGHILTNVYEYSEDVDDYEDLIVNILQEAIVKGTAIGYEGHQKKTKFVRNVKKTGDDITVKQEKVVTNSLHGSMVKLEDFYPSSPGIKSIKLMPFCFWREIMPYQQFLQDWSAYSKSEKVMPYTMVDNESGKRPFYLDYVSNDAGEGNVEIIKYYNQENDEYVIIANGVWLNPLHIKKETDIQPLPFNHKELPFWEVKFESFGNDFFYGKSLPDKLKSLQDVLNVLTNMLLDQSFLTIFKPMLTAGYDSIEDDYLRPGRRTPVDTQGLPLKDAYQLLDLGTPTGWHQFILDYTRKVMEEASIDQVSQGIAGVGDRTTAQEIRVAAEGVASMLGLFGKLIKSGIKRKALLRCKNILQFWTDKNSPIIERILGEDGTKDFSKAFNIFKIDDTITSKGKRGQKIIEIFADKESLPKKDELKARAEIFKIETGKHIEIIAIPTEYIRDFEFDAKMVVNPKSDENKDSERALQLEKVRVYMSFFPEQVNIKELAAQTAEKMGDDPTKILNEDVFPMPPDEKTRNSELDKGMGTMPQGNLANNTARSMRGGEESANQLRDLQSQLGK
ncbi:MAG: hypothetical protein GWP19_01485 [Planctomycetia bacterium]|nr:hypothetical protein [Planctomycetia bacterium]